MKTILRPCKVPWMISPSMSGVTIQHMETDVQPECMIVFGGGRLQDTGLIDQRRVVLTSIFAGLHVFLQNQTLKGLSQKDSSLLRRFQPPQIIGLGLSTNGCNAATAHIPVSMSPWNPHGFQLFLNIIVRALNTTS